MGFIVCTGRWVAGCVKNAHAGGECRVGVTGIVRSLVRLVFVRVEEQGDRQAEGVFRFDWTGLGGIRKCIRLPIRGIVSQCNRCLCVNIEDASDSKIRGIPRSPRTPARRSGPYTRRAIVRIDHCTARACSNDHQKGLRPTHTHVEQFRASLPIDVVEPPQNDHGRFQALKTPDRVHQDRVVVSNSFLKPCCWFR